MAKGLTIVAVPPVGQVAQIGTDQARGVSIEGASWDHSLPDKGARQAQFTLRRKPQQEWPDLQPFTPIIIYKAGSVAWSGRIQQTPTIRGRENQITVICEGWPAHLKDDAIEKTFVHNDLTAWRDARSFSPASLAIYTSAYGVTTGEGTIAIRVGNGTTVPISGAGGVTLDLGPYNTAKRVVVTYIGGGLANFGLKYLAGDTAAASTEFGTIDATPIAVVSTTAAFTLSTPRRFVTLFMDASALTNVATDDAWVELTNIIVVSDTAYESGNVSILKASQVIPAVLPYAPKLSQSTLGITTTTFSIPHFAGPVTSPDDYLSAVNDYHGYQLFLRDAADGGSPFVVFRPIPSSPTLVANVGNGIEFNDASRNDGSEIYNRVIVEYTDAAGNTAREERTTANLSAAIADPDIAFDSLSATQFSNPSFDTNLVGWTTTAGTATRDTGVFDSTPASMRFTASAGGLVAANTALPAGLTIGKTYQITARVQRAAANVSATTILLCLVGPALVQLTPQPNNGTSSAAFTTVSALYTPQAGYTSSTLQFTGQNCTASVDAWYIDSVRIYEARPTIVDRQGFLRTRVLATGSRLTSAAAQQIGDIYLQAHRFTPLRGSLTVQGAAVRTLTGDVPIPAHLLGGRNLGDAILINETDPDLGSIGRVGYINAVAYDQASDTATVSVDQNKDFVAQLLSRIQVFS